MQHQHGNLDGSNAAEVELERCVGGRGRGRGRPALFEPLRQPHETPQIGICVGDQKIICVIGTRLFYLIKF